MIPNQDNGDGSDNGWAAATISAILLPGLLGFTFDHDDHDDHYHHDDDHDYFVFDHFDHFGLCRGSSLHLQLLAWGLEGVKGGST